MAFKKSLRTFMYVGILLLILAGCSRPDAKYVFYFIGDGMGPVQINAAERYLAALEGKTGIIPLELSITNHTGTITTNSSNRYITDSGAAVTALATGHKTVPQTLSMDARHRYPLKTIAEKAKEHGMKVGIISTVDIDHATPAGFYAHNPYRGNYFEIAKSLAMSNFDFFGGGEIRYAEDPDGEDTVNIYDLARDNGLVHIKSAMGFRYLEPGAGRIFFEHPDVIDDHSMPYAIDMDEETITLAQIVQKSIKMLKQEEGFFIMIEGGKIDWAGHQNDAATIIKETLAFNDAVKVALKFYEKHKKETFIVITADHETGGMSLGTTYGDYGVDLSKLKWQTASFSQLTREFRNIRDRFINESGRDSVYINDAWALEFLRNQTGLGDETKGLELNEYELKELKDAYRKSFDPIDRKNPYEYIKYGPYDPFMVTASHMLSRKCGVGWTTFSHTGIPVPVKAFGVGAAEFGGFYDNTEIPKRIEKIMLK